MAAAKGERVVLREEQNTPFLASWSLHYTYIVYRQSVEKEEHACVQNNPSLGCGGSCPGVQVIAFPGCWHAPQLYAIALGLQDGMGTPVLHPD